VKTTHKLNSNHPLVAYSQRLW